MSGRVLKVLVWIVAAAIFASQPARATNWPQRTVKLIVPLPAGGGTDLAARLFAEELSRRWGQPVIVDNRPGPDGILAVTGFVSSNDDHTLLFSSAGPISINPLIHEKLPYDPVRDLVPITAVAENFLAIAVSTPTGLQSVDALIKAAKAAPERFNWASTPGLPQYIFLALQQKNGLTLTQVPYRDFAASAMKDFAENRIQIVVTSPTFILPVAESGKARMLMIANRKRFPLAPEVPTAEEAGFPELAFDGIVGFFGGRNLNAALRDRIAEDVAVAGRAPEIGSRLKAAGIGVRTGTPAEFASAIEEQRVKIRDIVATDRRSR